MLNVKSCRPTPHSFSRVRPLIAFVPRQGTPVGPRLSRPVVQFSPLAFPLSGGRRSGPPPVHSDAADHMFKAEEDLPSRPPVLPLLPLLKAPFSKSRPLVSEKRPICGRPSSAVGAVCTLGLRWRWLQRCAAEGSSHWSDRAIGRKYSRRS